ncbi:MAG: hypothetical protein FWC57_05425, partial [Endomicrobia bacterium]|nr:hypothetical protein [Endomicrobiia bacterium]
APDKIYSNQKDAAKYEADFDKLLKVFRGFSSPTSLNDKETEVFNKATDVINRITDKRFNALKQAISKNTAVQYADETLKSILVKSGYKTGLAIDRINNPAKYDLQQQEEQYKRQQDLLKQEDAQRQQEVDEIRKSDAVKNKEDFINKIKDLWIALPDIVGNDKFKSIDVQIAKYFNADRGRITPERAIDLSAALILQEVLAAEMKKAAPDMKVVNDAFEQLGGNPSKHLAGVSDLAGHLNGISLGSVAPILPVFFNNYSTLKVNGYIADFKKAGNNTAEAKKALDNLNTYISNFANSDLLMKNNRLNSGIFHALNYSYASGLIYDVYDPGDGQAELPPLSALESGAILCLREIARIKAAISEAQSTLNISALSSDTDKKPGLIDNLHKVVDAVNPRAVSLGADQQTIAKLSLELDVVNRLTQSVLDQMHFFLPDSYSVVNNVVGDNVKNQLMKDYRAARQNAAINVDDKNALAAWNSAWAEAAAKRNAVVILADALNREISNGAKADVNAMEKMVASLTALVAENPENANFISKSDFAKADMLISTSKSFADKEILNGAAGSFNKLTENDENGNTKQKYAGLDMKNAVFSSQFRKQLEQVYFRSFFNNWENSDKTLSDKQYIAKLQDAAAAEAAATLQNDMLLDALIMEIDKADKEKQTQISDSEKLYIMQLRDLVAKLNPDTDFVFKTAGNQEYAISNANRILGVKQEYDEKQKAAILGKAASAVDQDELNRQLESLFQSYVTKGEHSKAAYLVAIVKEMNPYVSVNAFLNNHFGSLGVSGIANTQYWSVTLTQTVDTKAVGDALKEVIENLLYGKKTKAAADIQASLMTTAQMDSVLAADFTNNGYNDFFSMGYFYEGFVIPNSIKDKMYKEFAEACDKDKVMYDKATKDYLQKIKEGKELTEKEKNNPPLAVQRMATVFKMHEKEILVAIIDNSMKDLSKLDNEKLFNVLKNAIAGLEFIKDPKVNPYLNDADRKDIQDKFDEIIDTIRNYPQFADGGAEKMLEELGLAIKSGQKAASQAKASPIFKSAQSLDPAAIKELEQKIAANPELLKFFNDMFADKLSGKKLVDANTDDQAVLDALASMMTDAQGNVVSDAQGAYDTMVKVKQLYDLIAPLEQQPDQANFINV